jgi:hypothetical protein
MKNINHLIINKHQTIIKYLIFVSSLFFIYLSFPEGGLFKYEFDQNDPWRNEDLIAEFDFRIEKSEEEYQKDMTKARNFVFEGDHRVSCFCHVLLIFFLTFFNTKIEFSYKVFVSPGVILVKFIFKKTTFRKAQVNEK